MEAQLNFGKGQTPLLITINTYRVPYLESYISAPNMRLIQLFLLYIFSRSKRRWKGVSGIQFLRQKSSKRTIIKLNL
jgi:hypothetical protein